jgi:SAM-dependent methyltransferase
MYECYPQMGPNMPSDAPEDHQELNSLDELFDSDYLRFYAEELNDLTNDDEAQTIADILQLQAGLTILDLPCGHGRIARRLQAMGATVTGMDRSDLFIQHAREDAAQNHATVEYQVGDMHGLDIDNKFDIVINWFTSFGYGRDEDLRLLLLKMYRALVPGGRLMLETLNIHQHELHAIPTSLVKELHDQNGTHYMIDRSHYDPHDGRIHSRRDIVNYGQATRRIHYSLRLFTLTELSTWLTAAGFFSIQAFGADGEVFGVDSSRMIVVAQKG